MWPFKPRQDKRRSRDKPEARGLVFRAVHRSRADNTLKGAEAIYAAVSRIGNTMGMLPLSVYRGWERLPEHPLSRVLGLEPNPNMSRLEFVRTMEACRNTEGNAYALILRDGRGEVAQLDVLDPTLVIPQRHPETREMWYWVQLEEAKAFPVPGSEIIALRHMSANGEVGIRPVDVLQGTLDYDKAVKDFSLNQLDGVNQGIFLKLPQAGLGDEARQKAINDFLDAYDRSGNRVVLLTGGMEATPFGQSPVDARVLDVERIMRNRVATIYNIPPHLLGDYSDASPTTVEQQLQEFLTLTILPIATQWEQELERKLLTAEEYEDGMRIRFDVGALDRADTVSRANHHQMAIRGGWMRPNEVRERENLPAVEDGDTLMASRDLIPLSVAIHSPDLLLAGESGGNDDEEEKEPAAGLL